MVGVGLELFVGLSDFVLTCCGDRFAKVKGDRTVVLWDRELDVVVASLLLNDLGDSTLPVL